jgi:hypothetical protein
VLPLITTALATHRITRLITEDVITEPFRNAVFARFGDPSTPHARYTPSYLVTCPHCASLYAAAAATTLAFLSTSTSTNPALRTAADLALTALAAAAVVSLYHERTASDSNSSGWAT